MSLSKHILEEHEEYYQRAYEILEDIGEIVTCPFHGYCYRKWKFDLREIYPIAIARLKQKYTEDKNFTLFSEKIKEVIDSAWDKCPECDDE